MTRHARSKAKAKTEDSELHEEWTNIAAQRYNQARTSGQKSGARTIIREVEKECLERTKKRVRLSKTTVIARANGRESIQQFNASKAWLSSGEEDTVVAFAIDSALRGFPLNHRRLKEHVDEICRARYGAKFPEDGVGKEWTHRFLIRHSKELHPYWSHALDNARARAVNPNNKDAYFALLKNVLEGDESEGPLAPDCIYGMDETGLQEGVGVSERVIGPAGQKVQYQQRSGERENITIIVTICADGSTTPPAVIYKGDAYQSNWKQDNPLNASLGYSKKGYTDGGIGIEWIKQFDKHTKAKARGRRRLLLVDGHASHYTYGFLDYARRNRIHVLCYPSHSTHIFQGLDVVIFSVLKRQWTRVRDEFERTKGVRVNKTNFLAVYAEAHQAALTESNIKAAFRKTGVVPFNPDIITSEMMTPSLETSTQGSLPLPPTSPVRTITQLLMDEVGRRLQGHPDTDLDDIIMHHDSQNELTPTPRTPTRVQQAVTALASSSAHFLVSPTPVSSAMTPPQYHPSMISPSKRRYRRLLDRTPSTILEEELQKALDESEHRDLSRKRSLMEMQAATVLQGLYVNRVQEKLQAKEEKGTRKKRKLLTDGLPRLLDGDEFFQKVTEHEAVLQREKAEKDARKAERDRYAAAIDEWTKQEQQRKERVAEKRRQYRAAIEEWEREKGRAKQEGRRAGWGKPKLGKIEPQLPKPKYALTKAAEADEERDEDEEDEDGQSDGEMGSDNDVN
ncbi:hypothetical protein ONZ51_g7033 [Trametes cubensis]|uniref:DDE-1 domain-containing protein n=1 Tax=Trametes cubensis TaxID=1111947 RepID=A0AAD7X9Y8_9APHY|nr:hypothetical protein ONZ51_g7033 [Trametes cubensis]